MPSIAKSDDPWPPSQRTPLPPFRLMKIAACSSEHLQPLKRGICMDMQELTTRPGSGITASFTASGVVTILMENSATRNAMSDESVTIMIDLLDRLASDTYCRSI